MAYTKVIKSLLISIAVIITIFSTSIPSESVPMNKSPLMWATLKVREHRKNSKARMRNDILTL